MKANSRKELIQSLFYLIIMKEFLLKETKGQNNKEKQV